MHIPEAVSGMWRIGPLVVVNDRANFANSMPEIYILGMRKHISQTLYHMCVSYNILNIFILRRTIIEISSKHRRSVSCNFLTFLFSILDKSSFVFKLKSKSNALWIVVARMSVFSTSMLEASVGRRAVLYVYCVHIFTALAFQKLCQTLRNAC